MQNNVSRSLCHLFSRSGKGNLAHSVLLWGGVFLLINNGKISSLVWTIHDLFANYELVFSSKQKVFNNKIKVGLSRLFGWMEKHFSLRTVRSWLMKMGAHWRLISALFRGFVDFPWPIQLVRGVREIIIDPRLSLSARDKNKSPIIRIIASVCSLKCLFWV
jgi:hypothetical protein